MYLKTLTLLISLLSLAVVASALKEPPKTLQIGIKKRVPGEQCTKRSRDGDTLSMHYVGTLFDTGEKFDSSYDRNQPLEFTLGAGRVIKGWDQGLKNMCIGEKRKLVIPPDLGYGSRGAGSAIPGDATLVFEVELVDIVEGPPSYNQNAKRSGRRLRYSDLLKNVDFQSPVVLTSIGVILVILALIYKSFAGTTTTTAAAATATTGGPASQQEEQKKKD